jgi:hypothetical protein
MSTAILANLTALRVPLPLAGGLITDDRTLDMALRIAVKMRKANKPFLMSAGGAHDVSGEARDEAGHWISGGGKKLTSIHEKLAAMLEEHPEHADAIRAAMNRVQPAAAKPTPKPKPASAPPAPLHESVKKLLDINSKILHDKRPIEAVQSEIRGVLATVKSSKDLLALGKGLHIGEILKKLPVQRWPARLEEEILETRLRQERSDY